jgi:hypothetical protein
VSLRSDSHHLILRNVSELNVKSSVTHTCVSIISNVAQVRFDGNNVTTVPLERVNDKTAQMIIHAALQRLSHKSRGSTFDSRAKKPLLSPTWPMKKSQGDRKKVALFAWSSKKVSKRAKKLRATMIVSASLRTSHNINLASTNFTSFYRGRGATDPTPVNRYTTYRKKQQIQQLTGTAKSIFPFSFNNPTRFAWRSWKLLIRPSRTT